MRTTDWEKEEIQNLLMTNNEVLKRGILQIYDKQTLYEQNNSVTHEVNGVGFNAFDAEFLTSIAMQIKEGRQLSLKQIAIARNKMKKYSKQLTIIANDKLHEKLNLA